MTLTMSQSGDKSAIVEAPTYIVTSQSHEASNGSAGKGIQKKHVLVGAGIILLSGLIIAGILVGMHIFAETQKDIIEFSLNFKSTSDGGNVKQDVVSDPNDNVVQYHVTKDGQDFYIVSDFNKDIQVVRMESDSGVNCYVSPLNRSAALDPSQITGPDMNSNDNTTGGATVFTVSRSAISDRSFLPKKAQDLCKDVPTYWAYRSCSSQSDEDAVAHGRQRRMVCKIGCGMKICACLNVRLHQYKIGIRIYCVFYWYCNKPCGAQPC